MKRIVLCIACMFLCSIAFPQKEIPSFGKIDKADLEMTDCDFDKGAEAVKLIDKGKLYYDRGTAGYSFLKTVYERRIRIKILKEKGLSYANAELIYYNHNNEEVISNLDAVTYNLDESGKVKVTDVSKSSIYTKHLNKQYSRLVIAFPEAKVGSVVEYRYKLVRESFTNLKDWYFQDVIPTRYSEYEINVPNLLEFSMQRVTSDNIDEKSKNTEEVINVGNDAIAFQTVKRNLIMRNLVGIHDEPFMGASKDYQQRLEFQLSSINYGNGNIENLRTNWTDVVTALMKDKDFGLQITSEVKGIDPLIKAALQITATDDRIKYLFNTIRSQLLCTDDEAIYTDNGVNATWAKKTGNVADINFLLINALNKAGIKAVPILLSTRDNGLVNGANAFLNQFNVVMAYIQLDNGYYVLDASDKLSNYKLTPERIVNTRAFLVEGWAGRVIDVIDNHHHFSMTVAVKGTIDDKGMLTGEANIISEDYARKERIERLTKNPDAFKQDYFIKAYPALSFQEISIKNQEYDSLPLNQKVIFTMPLNSSEGYSYFTTNLFSDFESNPFIMDHRNTDVDFGSQQKYTIYGNFTIPEGYSFDALPQNMNMSMPGRGADFSRVMEARGNVLNVVIKINFHRTYYPVTDYADFREFYKKLLTGLNEQVVIKKKS